MKPLPQSFPLLLPTERVIKSKQYERRTDSLYSITKYTDFGWYLMENGLIIDTGYTDNGKEVCIIEKD